MQSEYNILYEGQETSNSSKAIYCDAPENVIPNQVVNKREVYPSKMFLIKLELQEFIKEHPDIPIYDSSQGDGGLSLGGIPREELSEALIRFLPNECTTKYGDPVGRIDVRRAIFENYYGFDHQTGLTPDHIIIGDGGRDILQKWYQLVQQDCGSFGNNIVVSAAPWSSYLQGPYINCMNILRAPGHADNGFKITPSGLDTCVKFSKIDGKTVAGLIITSPDNPTGNYMPPEEMILLIEHAIDIGIAHVFLDLMYQAVTDPEVGRYDVNSLYQSLSAKARGKVCFMDGLTKSAGASNLRNAHLVVGAKNYIHKIKGIATHTVIPNAIGEAAALEVYSKPEPTEHPWIKQVSVPTSESRKIVQKKFRELDYKFIAHQGYYAFLNIWPWLGKRIPDHKKMINSKTGEHIQSIDSVVTLESYLTTKCGLAIIHGTVFKQPHFIRFSYANLPEYTEASIIRLHESLKELE